MTEQKPAGNQRSGVTGWLVWTRMGYQQLRPESKNRLRAILIGAWFLLLISLTIWLLRNRRDELETIWQTIKGADRRWLAAALGVELLSNLTVALTYWWILRRLGHQVSVLYQLVLHIERHGVNLAAPFAGAATSFVYATRMRRHGVPPEDSLLTLLIRSASVYGATFCILLLAAFLSDSALVLLAALAVMVALVGLSAYAHQTGTGEWKTIRRWALRLPASMQDRILAAVQRLQEHNILPLDLAKASVGSLLTRICAMTLIATCLLALDYHPTFRLVFFAYVISYIAGRLVPVLYGMGAIEGSMALALQSRGVPTDIAIGSTLLFRFLDFWLTSLIGLVIYVIDERRRTPEMPELESASG